VPGVASGISEMSEAVVLSEELYYSY